MEKINVAELLRNCPKGMELDCTMFDDVQFIDVNEADKPICIRTGDKYRYLTKFGTWAFDENAKCVIFPKGKTTWEGFVPPYQFKDGDIVACDVEDSELSQVFIICGDGDNNGPIECYAALFEDGLLEIHTEGYYVERYATEEEKQRLFQAIKGNGYKWNAETKALEKLIVPKFKVGDRVKHISGCTSGIVVKVADKGYHIDYPKGKGVCYVSFTLEKDYELAPNKFDITTLKPFDKVLIRNVDRELWKPALWGFYINTYGIAGYYVNGGSKFEQCIPYEGNEHLLGTLNDCDEFYKTWK